MGRNRHPISERRVTGWNGTPHSLDLDQAHATTADRFQSFIVTERGNIDTDTAARFQDRNTWLKLMNLSVNDSFRQLRTFSLC